MMAAEGGQDRLDALWATFRLPVPLATPGKHSNSDGPSAARDEWTLRALDLLRLLHTMNEQYDNPKALRPRLSSYTPPRERVMESQMSVAQSLLSKVEGTFPSFDEHEQVYRQNCHVLLQKLRNDTGETCAKFQRWLDRRSEQQKTPKERDLLYDIFLAPDEPAAKDQSEEPLDEFDDFAGEVDTDEDDVAGSTAKTETVSSVLRQQRQPQHTMPTQQALDPAEFAKQQQQLLEEELASMAARLKSSTLAMNTTLRTQTIDLDDMEQLAQTNLDQVTDTTKKVEDRLARNRGWKKRLATWSVVGTVVGMWVLCFMIMRTVPKRRIGEVRWLKEGGAVHGLWKQGKRYFSGDGKKRPSRSSWELDEDELARHKREYFEEREEMRREKERREQQRQQEQQECEILGDGTQVCSDSPDNGRRTLARGHELAAERRRRRIEENMANALAVDAVDSVEEDDSEPDSSNEEDEDDPMGCVPPTKEMHVHQSALDELAKAMKNIEKGLSLLPEDSDQWRSMARNKDRIEAQSTKHYSALEAEMNKARGAYWVDREVREKARDLRRALGSVPFCKEGHVPKNKEDGKVDEEEKARREEEARRREEERKTKFQEEVRLAREAQARADAEMIRRKEEEQAKAKAHAAKLEQERRAAEAAKLAEEQKKQEREKVETVPRINWAQPEVKVFDFQKVVDEQKQEEAAAKQRDNFSANFQRLVDEFEMRKKQQAKQAAERERLEKERIEKEREERRTRVHLAGVDPKDEEEARRLAAEREEADRLERERFEATAEERAKARLISEAIARAEAGAKEAMEQAKEVAPGNVLPSDIRFAAGRLQNDLLAHYISASPHMIDASDRSGWRPIHEAARAGNLAGCQLLVSSGVDLTSRTGRTGNGGTALWWAIQRFGEDNDVVRLLRSHGALDASQNE